MEAGAGEEEADDDAGALWWFFLSCLFFLSSFVHFVFVLGTKAKPRTLAFCSFLFLACAFGPPALGTLCFCSLLSLYLLPVYPPVYFSSSLSPEKKQKFAILVRSSVLVFCCLWLFFFSPSSVFPWLPWRLSVRGGRGCNRGLEEDDDEGAVAGQNLLSPLYNLPPRFCDFFRGFPSFFRPVIPCFLRLYSHSIPPLPGNQLTVIAAVMVAAGS